MGHLGLTIGRFGGIIHARYGDRKVWGREVWPPDITKPSIKGHNHPLCSTFLHSNPIKKISVRIIIHNKPPNHPFKSLPNHILGRYPD
jgi:hypothetical protein